MKIANNYSLLAHNTFMIDVKTGLFAEYDNVEELCTLLKQYKGEHMLHIGAGSNLLFTGDFCGVVLHSQIKGIELQQLTEQEVVLRVGAGEVFDDFVQYTVNYGWAGAENLSNIPGEVGASAVQNIGAYGVEAKDIIRNVHTLDTETLEPRIFSVENCKYAYRDSIFKNEMKDKYIVTAVEFALRLQPTLKLDYGNLRSALQDVQNPTVADVRKAIINVRNNKLPKVGELGSAGSFFKNPVIAKREFEILISKYPNIPYYIVEEGVKIPAAWLIEQCGLKGRRLGGAIIYEKQPLVIVNAGSASPQDIIALAELVRTSVMEKFNIEIYPEVNYV